MLWAWLWAAVILVLTLMPGNDVPTWSWADTIHFDKFVHVVLFGGQAFLLGQALAVKGNAKKAFLVAMVVAIAYGGTIELLQGAMGMGRDADFFDLLADSVGAVIAFVILSMQERARV